MVSLATRAFFECVRAASMRLKQLISSRSKVRKLKETNTGEARITTFMIFLGS